MKKPIFIPAFISIYLLLLLPATLFAQITDQNSIVASGATVEKLGEGYTFTEGPAADAEGNVFFTDQPNNKILRWSARKGDISTFVSESGRSNGMYFDENGNLIACADMNNQIWSFDELGNFTILLEKYDGKLLNGPNDLWIDPQGGIYFTDPLYKRKYWERDPEMQQDGQHVYYMTPDRKRVIRVDEELEKPNGIVGTPDGKNLYVADIGAGKTYVYNIEKDATLSNKTLFAPIGSDGMTIDNKGNLYLTGEGVTVFDKKGEQIAKIPLEGRWTANVCFGGTDRKLLFITATDAVFGLKMNVKGVK